MIQIKNGYVYKFDSFFGWIRCGKLVKGFDGNYIQWFK